MSVDSDMELSSSSWKERVNKRSAAAEESDPNLKRARGDSFAKRVKNNQNNKEREF